MLSGCNHDGSYVNSYASWKKEDGRDPYYVQYLVEIETRINTKCLEAGSRYEGASAPEVKFKLPINNIRSSKRLEAVIEMSGTVNMGTTVLILNIEGFPPIRITRSGENNFF